jgi:hypothetical protein
LFVPLDDARGWFVSEGWEWRDEGLVMRGAVWGCSAPPEIDLDDKPLIEWWAAREAEHPGQPPGVAADWKAFKAASKAEPALRRWGQANYGAYRPKSWKRARGRPRKNKTLKV